MNRSRRVIVLIMLVVLAVTLAGAFMTRGVMAYLPFLQARKGNLTGAYVPLGIVDQRPWQTAATLAALAQSAEERKIARDAERLGSASCVLASCKIWHHVSSIQSQLSSGESAPSGRECRSSGLWALDAWGYDCSPPHR